MEAESGCSSSSPAENLTEDQKERIHINKEKAHALRERRRKAKPYDGPTRKSGCLSSVTHGADACTPDLSKQPLSLKNTHAGFIIDDDDESSGRTHSYRRVEEEGK